jgi:aspartyl-tRNA(Asn)/glutamyl-tRNA(Gln) amidotransferase subunit B
MQDLEVIIGLEVHAQMNTKTKMFCGCDNDAFGKPPNTTVCPICMGHPGTLPVPNKESILKAIKASLALHCTVNPSSHFDRKHYFYPDLPSGFQISQYDFPLASHGYLDFDRSAASLDSSESSASSQKCRIHRLHIENDAGKLSHFGDSTLCDYNRAGTPLMEIVTEPDLRSADEAVAFAEELRRTLIAVDASEADMFKGMMRFDASISLREKGTEKLNPRSEIKNLNSFKSLEKALQYEEKRLRKLWEEEHGPLKGNITVGWMDDEEKTRMLRDKESADDYRYFPEPDIPPLKIDAGMLKEISAALPKLPRELKKRYIDLKLTSAEADILIDQPILRFLFNMVYEKTNDAKRTSSLVLTQLMGFLNAHQKSVSEGPDVKALLELIAAIDAGTISANAGKEVLEEMVVTGKSPNAIIESKGMKQISDTGALEQIVKKAVAANPDAIASYKKGKTQALGAIVGWVMKETKGQANPGVVNELLRNMCN